MDLTDPGDTPEQADLREAVRGLLREHPGESAWPHLTAQMGLAGLAIPERHGGAGAKLAEVAVVVEEAGRVLLPAPYLSAALTGAIIAEAVAAGTGGEASQFLPGLADGSVLGALALDGEVTAADGRLSGRCPHVLDGARADLLVVRASGALHVVRAADAVITPVGTLDQSRSQAVAEFRDAPAIAVGLDTGRAEQLMQVMLAAESVAAAEHCLAVTVEYLKTRVQFGRPIGGFQALRHRCADLAVAVVSARATASAAVRACAGPPASLAVVAPLAKRHCAEVFLNVAAEMIQLHGGIGFTWEHQAHRYFKRAKTTQLLHGTPADLRRTVAHRAGLLP
jgi:hypothetical protein